MAQVSYKGRFSGPRPSIQGQKIEVYVGMLLSRKCVRGQVLV